MVLMWVVVLRSGPDVRMAPLSTYRVIGESVIFLSLIRGLSSVDSTMYLFVLWNTSSIMDKVKYAARIGKTHDPCGTPVSIGHSSSLLPSCYTQLPWIWARPIRAGRHQVSH